MMDAVEGRMFAPAGTDEEKRAYAVRYTEYFGAELDRAYVYIDQLDGKRDLMGRAMPSPEEIFASSFEQLSLFGGGG